jgi:glycosyltransferase involved in cell wall biosynthesis
VIARPVGALPEIVRHGRTGFLAEDVPGIAAAITAAGDLDRAVCRREAEARFDRRVMAARYLDLYRTLADRGACPA